MRVLLAGWFSFLHGEATAGDLLALAAVRHALDAVGLDYDVAWSAGFRPGGLTIEDAQPDRYSHLVFVCGPLHGEQFTALHVRFAGLRRIAVGVSVIDRADPACTGFHLVLARDGTPAAPRRDLASAAPTSPPPPIPVAGIALTGGQGEYGSRRRHEQVTARLTEWIGGKHCAPVVVETRLDPRDWQLCSTAGAFQALLGRLDVIVTTRLHGLVLGLGAGIPVLAVDPVDGGAKVTAQAVAWQWPAIVTADQVTDQDYLDAAWDWCLSPAGRGVAAARAGQQPANEMLSRLMEELGRADPALSPRSR
jgi:hypothetical protein